MNLGNREGVYILPNKGQIMKIANDEKRGTNNLKGNSWWGKQNCEYFLLNYITEMSSVKV